MAKYYRTYNAVYEDIGHNTLRCIASYRKNMLNVLMINSNPDDKALSALYPYDSKEKALATLKEDALWDNAEVFIR